VIGVPPRPLTGSAVVTGTALAGTDATGSTLDEPDHASPSTPSRASTGERIARRFFELCENPRTRDRVMRTVRSSANSAVGGRLLVALLSRTVLTPLLRSRRVDGLATKTELVAAQLGGIAVLRYVTRMEPVASMSVEDLVALVGPTLQATIEAPLRDPAAGVPSSRNENGPRHQG
jgi:hypothetical protein